LPLEGLGKLKNPMTSSGIDSRIVRQPTMLPQGKQAISSSKNFFLFLSFQVLKDLPILRENM
jgi:hypothetical protein